MPEPYPQKYKLGTKIQKEFDGHEGLFEGTITNFIPETGFYIIKYDNGDEEEMDQDGITQQLSMYGSSNSGTTTPRCEILEVNWLEKYNRLRKFKDEYGHCRVPQGYHHDPSLGRWVQNQRSFFKKSKLSPDRVEKLNQIGFVWQCSSTTHDDQQARTGNNINSNNNSCNYSRDPRIAVQSSRGKAEAEMYKHNPQRVNGNKTLKPLGGFSAKKGKVWRYRCVVEKCKFKIQIVEQVDGPNEGQSVVLLNDCQHNHPFDAKEEPLEQKKQQLEATTAAMNDKEVMPEDEPIDGETLVFEKDKPLIREYLFLAFQQMRSCTFQDADRVGCCKTSNNKLGQPGLACRHCVGWPGHGRYFPASLDSLLQTTTSKSIVNHLRNCPCCPVEIRNNLEDKFGLDGTQANRPQHGGRKIFFRRLWHRIQVAGTHYARQEAPVPDCCQFCSNPAWNRRIFYKCGTVLTKYFPASDNNPNPGWYEGTIKKHNISSAEEESKHIWNEIHYDDGDIENLPQDELKLLMDDHQVKVLHSMVPSNLDGNCSVHKPATYDMMNGKEINNEKWLEKYERLIDFKNKTGHCRVPHNYGPDPSLGYWVKAQRERYKKENPPMAADRIEILNQIGFDWVLNEQQPTPHDTDTGTESPDQSWKMDEKLVQENVQAAIHHDKPEATNSSTETSHQDTGSDMTMMEECKASSSSGKQQRPSRTTLNDSDSVTTTGTESLSVALQHSLDSTKTMQEWDGKMGLNRHYSETMLQSSKSREQLLAANVTGSYVSDGFSGGKVSAAAKPEQPTCVGKTGSSKSAAPSTQASPLSPLKQHPSESSPNQKSITSQSTHQREVNPKHSTESLGFAPPAVANSIIPSSKDVPPAKPKEFHPPEDTNCGQTVKAVAVKATVTSLVGIVLKNHPEQGVFINSLTPTSIFRRSALRAGMKIISVNGTDCRLLDKVAVAKILKDYTGQVTIWASIPVPTASPPPDPATKKSGGMHPVCIRFIQRDNPLGGKRCPTAIADVRYNETIPKNTTLKDAYDNPAVIYRVRHVSRSTAELIANGTAEAVLALVDHKFEETIQVYPVRGLETVLLLDIVQKCTPIDQKPEPITFLFYVQDKKKTPPALSPKPEVNVIDD